MTELERNEIIQAILYMSQQRRVLYAPEYKLDILEFETDEVICNFYKYVQTGFAKLGGKVSDSTVLSCKTYQKLTQILKSQKKEIEQRRDKNGKVECKLKRRTLEDIWSELASMKKKDFYVSSTQKFPNTPESKKISLFKMEELEVADFETLDKILSQCLLYLYMKGLKEEKKGKEDLVRIIRQKIGQYYPFIQEFLDNLKSCQDTLPQKEEEIEISYQKFKYNVKKILYGTVNLEVENKKREKRIS